MIHTCLLSFEFFPVEVFCVTAIRLYKQPCSYNREDAGKSAQVKADSSEFIVRKTLPGSSARVTGRPITR